MKATQQHVKRLIAGYWCLPWDCLLDPSCVVLWFMFAQRANEAEPEMLRLFHLTSFFSFAKKRTFCATVHDRNCWLAFAHRKSESLACSGTVENARGGPGRAHLKCMRERGCMYKFLFQRTVHYCRFFKDAKVHSKILGIFKFMLG